MIVDQGIGRFTGPATWLGGGATVFFQPRPKLVVQLGFSAEGGAFPRDATIIKGSRLIPEVGGTYYFTIGPIGLGPQVRLSACRTAITIDSTNHLTDKTDWWVFRAGLGPALRLPFQSRITFDLKALVQVYAKGQRYVGPEDTHAEVFKTALLEIAVQSGISVLF